MRLFSSHRVRALRFSPLAAVMALPVALAASSQLVACSGAPADSTGASAEGALVSLSSNEVVGTLTYGETSTPIAYRDTPRYRAFKFSGKKGDAVSALVTSASGHPDAWILNANFSTVASGPADGSQLTETVTATLPKTATYYVAFRDYWQEDATFTVTLEKGSTFDGGAPLPDAGSDAGALDAGATDAGPLDAGSDARDPDTCTGDPITLAEATAHFAPGATSAQLAPYSISLQERACNAVTGCTAWTGSTLWYSIGGTYEGQWSDVATSAGTSGNLLLTVSGSTVNLTLDAAGSTCTGIEGPSASCTYLVAWHPDGQGGNEESALFAGPIPPASANAYAGNTVQLQGLVTNHCAQLTFGGGPTDQFQAVLTSTW